MWYTTMNKFKALETDLVCQNISIMALYTFS